MNNLITQLHGVKVNMEEDVFIAILLKSLPQEDHEAIVTTLKNLPSLKLLDVVGLLTKEEKMFRKRMA